MKLNTIFNLHTIHKKMIKVDRESVCMGDDCMAPNEQTIEILSKDTNLTVLKKVATVFPTMQNVVWAVDTGRKILGYIIMDDTLSKSYEICEQEQSFFTMGIDHLHGSYFHKQSFMHHNQEQESIEQTLLDKVKYHMHERFLEELKLNGGCLCIWGEYFGRPHDNYHKVISARWSKEEITIHFREGESLYISNPIVIKNEEDQLVIGDATKILWVWYTYGKEQSYNNLYVLEYVKQNNGEILKASGKRKDVKDGDGKLFHPISNTALTIQSSFFEAI